jgi:hypothetical protein
VSQGLKVVSPADGSVYAERPLADRMALDAYPLNTDTKA